MRGAGLRLNNDVRRLWRCSACGVQRRLGADVTSVNCQCAGRPSMKLIEERRRERPFKELTATYLEFEFEPGELNPPQPRMAEDPAPPQTLPAEQPSAGTHAEMTDTQSPEPDSPGKSPDRAAAASASRPSRRDDRRGPARHDRSGSGPSRGSEPRNENPARRDQRRHSPPQPKNSEEQPSELAPNGATDSTPPDSATPDNGPEGSAARNGDTAEPNAGRRNRRRRRRGPRPEGRNPSGEDVTRPDTTSFGEGIAPE